LIEAIVNTKIDRNFAEIGTFRQNFSVSLQRQDSVAERGITQHIHVLRPLGFRRCASKFKIVPDDFVEHGF